MTARRKPAIPAARWGAISRCTAHDAPPATFCEADMFGERRWVALLPVAVPRDVAELLDEERPLRVVDLPRIANGLGAAVRPLTRASLLRANGLPLLALHDPDPEALLALVALIDGERAVELLAIYEQQDSFIEVREVVMPPRAMIHAALFGGSK
jgi:hypothetical protein